jgi:DNA-binding transcriptional ArsR family regulator
MTDSLSRTFAALADPTRRAILAQIADRPSTVSEIVAKHRLTQPAISKHLKVLADAGLVTRGRDGQTRPCALAPDGMKTAAQWIDHYRSHWEGAFARIDTLIDNLKSAEDRNGRQ